MNLSDCIAIYRTLGANADKNLGMRNNYNVALNLKALEEVIKPFDELRNKKLDELKEAHGEEEVPQDVVEKFNEELFKVLQEDQDVKLKISAELRPELCRYRGVPRNSNRIRIIFAVWRRVLRQRKSGECSSVMA